MKTLTDGALEHVHHFAVHIGSRLIGSTANRDAADYISATFKNCGLSVEKQEIPCPNWIDERSSLELNGQSLEVYTNTFSPACDITGEITPACTMAEFESAAIAGRILLLYGDMSQHELAAKGAIYVSERDRRILQRLEEERPAGIITVNPTLHESWRLIEDYDLDIPSVTVPASAGLQLLKNPGVPVHLNISTRRSSGSTANVIGRLQGELPARIVLCAHYDTKADTPGAYDNAAGVGILLTLAEALSQKKYRHTIECVAFTGEEGYGLGDMEYARNASRPGHGFDRVTAALNFDGVGPFTGTTTVACFAASPALETLVDQKMTSYPGVIKVEPWPASDHYIFYSNGTPSLAFTSRGIRDIYHTMSDTFEWISGEKLAEAIRLGLDLVEELDQKDLAWTRPNA